MKSKLWLIAIAALVSVFVISCNNDTTNNANPPELVPQQAGLGKGYSFTNEQVYDENNRSQAWDGNVGPLAIGTSNISQYAGHVIDGKLSIVLPELTVATPDSSVILSTLINPNNVNFLFRGNIDYWADGIPNTDPQYARYRFRMREPGDGYYRRWWLIYADKAGVVQCTNNVNPPETFDLDLVAGWNSACMSGSTTHYVTQNGIENTRFYYDGIGKSRIDEFTTWNGDYLGDDGNGNPVTVTINMTALDITGHSVLGSNMGGNSLTIGIRHGGWVKDGDADGPVIGRYAFIYQGANKIGLLVYASDDGNDNYAIGLGTSTSPPDGAYEKVIDWEAGGVWFVPAPDLTGIPTSYWWGGDKQ